MAADDRQRIEKALAYIAANLDRPLGVAEVAKVAKVSEFHFHRLFASLVGESVGQFIARSRLETAALRLAYHPTRSVTEVALASGYSSTANFSKAFAAYFGCRPTDVRDPSRLKESRIGKLTSRYGKDFDPSALYALPHAPDDAERNRRKDRVGRDLRFEDRNETELACLASQAGYELPSLVALWDDLVSRVRALGLSGESVDAYGIAHDSPTLTAPELCRYHACVPIPSKTPLSPPLFRATIPAGRYAIVRHRGPVESLADTYRDVYSVWFPESGLEPDDFHPFEHYVNDAPVDGHVDMELGFKVRPRRR